MSPADLPRASKPAYSKKLLGDEPNRRPAGELFLHLGYWPQATSAASDYAELLAAQARLNERLLALADLRDDMRVLDAGCGMGGTLAAIAQRHRGMDLVGLNIDRAQLDVARASIRVEEVNRCAWIEGDACSLPFDDASFDRVLAIECIFHFPSRRRFFAEAARVLTPGGLLVLSDFVATPTLRALRDSQSYPGFAIEAAIVPAVGPWPDFWGEDADAEQLARAAGYVPLIRSDVSRETLPSYGCFLHQKPTALDAVDRAMVLMQWLQSRGFLRMELMAFRIAPPGSER